MTIRFIRLFLLLALFSVTVEMSAQCGNSGFTISSPRCIGQSIVFADTTSTTADSTLWRFSSGGTIVNNDTARKTYAAAGSDTVWMYRFYTSPDTCVDTVFAVFTVTDPTVTVTPAGPVNICTGGSAILTANAGPGLTYQWMLNGADIGGETNQTLQVSTNGTYSVRTVGSGCTDTSSAVTVTVFNYPNADFIFGPDSACSGTTVNFINTSTGSSLTHSWQFGNAGTSTIANPNFAFDTSGTRSIVSYQVRLITSTPGNCNDTITKTVYVRRKPYPDLGDFNNIPPFIQCNVGSFPFVLQMDNTSTTMATNASYSINWGDGSSQNFGPGFDTITHVFATAGLFVVQVTATDSAGCPSTRTVNVFNGGNPGVSLGNSGSTSGCTPYSLNFTIDTSKLTGVGNNADGTTYTYTFNDGSAPVTYTHPPPPIHNKIFDIPSCGVATPGFNNAFQVELVVSNPCGNNSSTIRPIYISTKPVAQIGIQPDGDTVCQDVPFIIYDDSDTGSVSSGSGCNETPRRLWNIFPATGWNLVSGYFGNHGNWNNNPANWGSGSLQVEFDDTGTYTVRLIVGNIAQAGVSVCGDDTVERIIRVFRLPVADFSLNLNPVSGCVNSTITTNNTSTGDELTYEWQVNPNSGYTLSSGTLTSPNPTFVFNTPGTYIVSLIASNRCSIDTAQDTIVMKGVPTATLPGAQQYCGPRVISFANLVANTTHRPTYNTNFADTISYEWTVTGGGYTYTLGDSTSSNPSIRLNDAGTYTVQVRIINECGTDTATQVITIHPLPVADYSVNDTDQCINGNSFAFTNGTTISSGSITSYNWNFGQAPTSTQTNPSKTYTSTGTFNVRLIAVSNHGCRDTIIKQVRVYPKPTPNFTINDTDQCINGNNFIFTNTSSIAGGGTNTHLWTFTNRANDTSTQTSPTKVYDTVGNFAVKLVVTSNNGCKDSITRTLRVYPKPSPAFTVNDTDQCLDGNSFQFTNTTTISSGTTTYTWRFGSSAADSSNSTHPTKVYAAEGNYTVKLIARSNNGCRDSVTGPVSVYPKPTVTYAVNDSDQCFTGNSFVFTNNSTISSGTVSYLWSFSNTAGDTSTQTHPSKVYTSTGIFPVKLVGTSDHGCKDSITRNMTVYPEPLAGFNINDTDQCLNGNNFIFTDTSVVGGPYDRSWSFGDGGTSVTANPSHSYASVDTFSVKLVVTITAGGCKDSVTRTVYTYPAPVPAFTVDDSVQCFPGHLFTFTNGSTISSGTNTYLWKFDAPSATDTSTAVNPTKTYTDAGAYIVRLIATSDNGCIDSAQRNVYPNPPIGNNIISASQGICS
ncbi:MAG TPA: PKD domain-containing protein, partial [Bacteroidia bacterium]|nr:PKD domain-containing protein [Bacteroidia bacterium]